MCGSGKRDCPESSSSSSSSSASNPCKTSTSNTTGNACGSAPLTKNSCDNKPAKERCNNVSTISPRDPCNTDSKKLTNSGSMRQTVKTPWDDPCPRACKLSSTMRCLDSSSRQKACPEPPPPLCSPTEEVERKARFWKMLTLLGALPTVLITSLIVKGKVEEESKQPRPKYVPMDYMYRRTKPFPWGDGNHSLFHNPVKNAVPPHGYEVDDPNEVKQNN